MAPRAVSFRKLHRPPLPPLVLAWAASDGASSCAAGCSSRGDVGWRVFMRRAGALFFSRALAPQQTPLDLAHRQKQPGKDFGSAMAVQ